jgi:hypothetical protein
MFTYLTFRVWLFGRAYCKVMSFTSYLTVASSVFTMLALTLDRHKAGHQLWGPTFISRLSVLWFGLLFVYVMYAI